MTPGPHRTGRAGTRVRRARDVVRGTLAESVEDRITSTAGNLAFHWFLAIFPALVAAVAVVGFVGLSTGQLRSLTHGVEVLFPAQMSQTVNQALRDPVRGTGGGLEIVLGLAIALWSGIEAMAALQVALDIAVEVPSDRGFVGRRLMAVPLFAVTVVLGGSASALLVLGDPIRSLLPASSGLARSTSGVAWGVLRWVGALALVVLLLSVYYAYGPNRSHPRFRLLSQGAVVAAVGWLVASAAFAFYLNHFGHEDRAYGAVAGVAALLLWLYVAATAVLLGAELDCELERPTD